MFKSKNFYDEFISGGFLEKSASENEETRNALGDLTPTVLEKLAYDLSQLSDDEDMTLEQKIASEESKEEEDKKEEPKEEDKEAECQKEEDKKEEPKEEDKEAECQKEEDKKEEPKEEDKEAECQKEEDKKEEPKEEDKEAECQKEEDKKEDKEESKEEDKDNTEEETVKQAYELAEQKLASSGLSVEDYVFQKTASEEVAYFVADNAEKLASLSGVPTLQVADEILNKLSQKLG